METVSQSRLYRLAKRLSVGRFLRYLDLWARYGWRRGQSVLYTRLRRQPATNTTSLAAALGRADVMAAKRMSVASWFPLDLANARLHRALLASVAVARPDLGVTPEILDCLSRLKSASDLPDCVDAMAERGEAPETVNTSELSMIASRHPRHALIAIQSGDEYRRQGRRVMAS